MEREKKSPRHHSTEKKMNSVRVREDTKVNDRYLVPQCYIVRSGPKINFEVFYID